MKRLANSKADNKVLFKDIYTPSFSMSFRYCTATNRSAMKMLSPRIAYLVNWTPGTSLHTFLRGNELGRWVRRKARKRGLTNDKAHSLSLLWFIPFRSEQVVNQATFHPCCRYGWSEEFCCELVQQLCWKAISSILQINSERHRFVGLRKSPSWSYVPSCVASRWTSTNHGRVWVGIV